MPDPYSGVPTLSDNINSAIKSGDQARNATTESMTNLAKLILGKQLEQQQQSDNIQKAQDLESQYSGKGKKASISLSGNGGVSISQNEPSMLSQLLGKGKAEGQAVQHAVDLYQKALPELQKKFSAVSEGVSAANDPKQMGSVGQARTLMLKSMGMNRYNENEAKAVLPPTAHQFVSEVFNRWGGDDNPLNDQQRATINQFFKNSLDTIKSQHDMLKKNALNSYQVSPFYEPTRADQLNSTIGKPFEESYAQTQKQMAPLPNTGYDPNKPPQPQPGMMDKLKSMLGFGGAQQPSPNQQQAPMSFEEFKAKKRAGAL